MCSVWLFNRFWSIESHKSTGCIFLLLRPHLAVNFFGYGFNCCWWRILNEWIDKWSKTEAELRLTECSFASGVSNALWLEVSQTFESVTVTVAQRPGDRHSHLTASKPSQNEPVASMANAGAPSSISISISPRICVCCSPRSNAIIQRCDCRMRPDTNTLLMTRLL